MALILTTLAKVRSESGFTNNANIDDTNDISPHANTAEGEILSFVGARYSLPLSSNTYWTGSPAQYFLSGIATEYGACLLMLKVYEGQGGTVADMVEKKIQNIKERLKMIQEGKILLLGSDGAELASTEQGGVSFYPTAEPTFNFSIDSKY